MMRVLYSLGWWLAMPLVLARLWWRGRKEPGYRQHLAERFGFYRDAVNAGKVIWIHAVSVGETRAAEPLVDALLHAEPECTLLMTHMTPTGRATGQALFGRHAPRLRQAYLPYDTSFMVRRFLQHFNPRICVLMETEVWPNVIAECGKRRVPVVLANARLSQRSLNKAHRLRGLMLEAAHGISLVAAQTEADATRLREFGARNVQVTGSIKFDVVPPAAMLELGRQWRATFDARPVLLCASTREGEEKPILEAMQAMQWRDALVVIVPRHPQRFDEVEQMIAAHGYRVARRTALDAGTAATADVVLGDSMGEMFAYYAACDLAFIGGSLLPLGGQNLIEACALGKPVLIGPHTFNFAAISEDAVAAGAALRVPDAAAMLQQARRLLRQEEERRRMGMRAAAFAQQHRGATLRTVALLKTMLR